MNTAVIYNHFLKNKNLKLGIIGPLKPNSGRFHLITDAWLCTLEKFWNTGLNLKFLSSIKIFSDLNIFDRRI